MRRKRRRSRDGGRRGPEPTHDERMKGDSKCTGAMDWFGSKRKRQFQGVIITKKLSDNENGEMVQSWREVVSRKHWAGSGRTCAGNRDHGLGQRDAENDNFTFGRGH